MVPVVNTDPDLADNPWGENKNTIRLTPDQLLGDLGQAFDGGPGDHWHSNPWKMPDEVIRMLPQIVMVSARLDILYRSQVAYKNRLQAQDVQIDWTEFDGLHQMKDMDQVTDAGRAVRQYVTQKSIELARRAKCTADGSACATHRAVPTLIRQDAMSGLDAMDSVEIVRN